MALLSREAILKAEDIHTEKVEVPEWGGEVLVRGLTGRQRDEFEGSLIEHRGRRAVMNTANMRAKLVSWSVVDEEGSRLFTSGDVQELGEHSAAAVNRIYAVAAKLSGLSDEDVDEMVADFGKTGGGSSSSHSQNGSTGPSKKS
jgi:hypothetical protein